ncbi:MAG: hypothetical protein JO090_01435 [Rhizobacter sp.]|nr:hypothetical protein [Rhizobacter sp.]
MRGSTRGTAAAVAALALVLGCAAAFAAQGRVTVTILSAPSPLEVRTCELQGGCGAGAWTDYE